MSDQTSGHATDMRHARIRRRVQAIADWYDIERNRRLDALDQERAVLLDAARKRCQHPMSAWVQYHEERIGCWVDYYRRSCIVCGKQEETDERPEHVERTIVRPAGEM